MSGAARPGSHVVTVWRIALDPARSPDAEALAELSEAERARAALFVTDALRNRWLTAHVAMRRILARELGVRPDEIVYGAGTAGKPFIASPAGSGVEYSFSDSGDLALLAVGRGGALGVDVEAYRSISDLAGVAERFFAPEERAALFALPESERRTGFYRLWTRKEAYIKAIGTGLGHALDRFVVTIGVGDVRLVREDGDASAAERWSLHTVAVPPGYEGALIGPRSNDAPIVRDWPAERAP